MEERSGALRESNKGAAGRELRILTWNINGLRKVAASHGGVTQLLDQFNADIVCFQEIKITRAGLVEHDLARAQGYHCLFNHCKLPRKVSYSGVATFVRSDSGLKTLATTTLLGDAAFFGSPGSFAGMLRLSPDRLATLDSEGRVLVTDHGHFVLFNVYAPCISSNDENEKMEDRRAFKRDFLAILEARILEIWSRGRGVVLVGDLNACASQLDHGFTMTDTEFYASNWSKWIRGMLGLGSSDSPRLVDCFRRLHPDRKGAFTCWNTQTGARENNYGTRIDYIMAGAAFADRTLQACEIMPDFLGSDHCPVRARFVIPLAAESGADGPNDAGKNGTVETPSRAEREWPEHPPECSCFYRELAAKQEKLTKYFVAGGQKQEPAAADAQGKGASGGAADRSGAGSSASPPAGGSEKGAGASMTASPGSTAAGTAGANGAGGWMMRGKRVGAAARASSSTSTSTSSRSSRGATARRLGSGGSRQSKLAFGAAAATPAVGGGGGGPFPSAGPTSSQAHAGDRGAGAGAGTGTGATTRAEGDAARVALRADNERGGGGGGDGGGPRASSMATATPSGSKAFPSSRDGDDAPADGEIGRSSTIGSESIIPGDAVGAGTGSRERANEGRGDSAQAWKAIFGQKKSSPPCEHREPSIQRTVLKPGPNYNRRFYTCARSAGNWPADRNARCNFFQWRRDGVRGYKDRPPRDESSTSKKRRI